MDGSRKRMTPLGLSRSRLPRRRNTRRRFTGVAASLRTITYSRPGPELLQARIGLRAAFHPWKTAKWLVLGLRRHPGTASGYGPQLPLRKYLRLIVPHLQQILTYLDPTVVKAFEQ